MGLNLLAGLLGVLFLTLGRMNSLKKDAETANIEFSILKYFQREWIGIGSSLVSVVFWLIAFPEVSNKYPELTGLKLCSFFAMGVLGSWILQKVLGNTKAWIRGIVDKKTDIADKKE